MGVKISTFTLTVPGHVVRRSKGSGTELEITGEQARYIFETLSEVTHLMPPDEVSTPPAAGNPMTPVSTVPASKAG